MGHDIVGLGSNHLIGFDRCFYIILLVVVNNRVGRVLGAYLTKVLIVEAKDCNPGS